MRVSYAKRQDIPIVKLVLLTERRIGKTAYEKIASSIRADGLLAPVIVFPDQSQYRILDGHVRYQVLLELNVESVPCIVWQRVKPERSA